MRRGSVAIVGLVLLSASAAKADAPMAYLTGYGSKAYPVVSLTWALLTISIAVVAILSALVLVGVLRRRAGAGRDALSKVEVARTGDGLRWISVGIAVSGVALLVSVIWTVAVLAQVNAPPGPAPLTIEITGHQWWWEVRYLSDRPDQIFTTANEIHIPTGSPVRLRLIGGDVIHSFWIPLLTGKTDTIPGQTNETWLEADKPGRYRGQCTEYCGLQHAHMATFVEAQAPAEFRRWMADQIRPAAQPAADEARRGESVFVAHCGACHAIRGTDAWGEMGPDLTHLMTRKTIAAGVLPNTVANLSGWIANPQSIKPGTRMPITYLSGPELTDLRSYLETLH